MKYRCVGCEDPCVVEIAMKADSMPTECHWGEYENPKWEEYEEPTDGLLSKLLAYIHRDGGDYQAEHGTAKAVEDAISKVCSWIHP